MSNQRTRPSTGRNQRRIAAQRKQQQRRLMMLGGAVGIALIAVIGAILLNGRGDSKVDAVVAAATTFDAGIPRDGQTLGNPDAPVTVEVWSDYQCPYCKNFSENMLPQLVTEYVATGKVRVIYRDFAFIDRAISINAAGTPVASGDGDSLRAAEAAAAAADQGLFWEYHAALFANQHDENGGSYSAARLREIAEIVGLDMDQFNASMDGHTNRPEVLSMYQAAVTNGINSTPTIIINGQEVGVGMYAHLKEAVDDALALAPAE